MLVNGAIGLAGVPVAGPASVMGVTVADGPITRLCILAGADRRRRPDLSAAEAG